MTMFEKIRTYYREKCDADGRGIAVNLPAYIVTIGEARKLVKECQQMSPFPIFEDTIAMDDDALKKHINAKGMTCYGITITVD